MDDRSDNGLSFRNKIVDFLIILLVLDLIA
jgi:hypothetical protein